MPRPTFGYPDWQRVQEHVDPDLLINAHVDTNGTYQSGVFFCGQWNGIYLYLNNAVKYAEVDVIWYADEAKTITLRGVRWVVDTFHLLQFFTPNYGPFVEITIISSPAGANIVDLRVQLTNRNLQPVGIGLEIPLIATGDINVGAGATYTAYFAYPYAGPVKVLVSTTAVAWNQQIHALDLFGTVSRIALIGPTAGMYEAFLPPMVNRIALQNADGVTRVFNCSVIPLFFRP